MNIAVIGAGYVGLVQAAGLTHLGHTVRVGEADSSRVESLNRGDLPIFERGLGEFIQRALDHGQLSFTSDNLMAVADADVVFLTLPTPPGAAGHADLRIVEAVVDQIGPHLEPRAVVVVKSTVPVGTTARLGRRLTDRGIPNPVVANPEFLREGTAMEDFLQAERVVIGADDSAAARLVAEVYRGLGATALFTDPASAELIKYGANAYLAARLTFANSLAGLAEHVGADILDVVQGIGLDRRIGPSFLRPGPGYGGSCFPKDTAALLAVADAAGYDFTVLRAVIEANRAHQRRIIDRFIRLAGGSVEGQSIAMWGVAFKAGTDDTRDSPAVVLADMLIDAGANVVAHDPQAAYAKVEMQSDPVAALAGADALIVATEWPEYMRIPADAIAGAMRGKLVLDTRNILDAEAMVGAGLDYHGLGRFV